MANVTQNDQRRYIEFGDLVVNYTDGDIVIFDNVHDLSLLYPVKPMTNMIAMCNAGEVTMHVNGSTVKAVSNDVMLCPPNVRISHYDISDDFECKVLCLSDRIIQGLLHDKVDVWHRAVYVNKLKVISMSEVCREEFSFYYALIRSKIQNRQGRPTPPYEIMQALVRALLLELCYILEHRQQDEKEEVKLSQSKMLFNRFLRLISNNDVKRRPIGYYASQLAITPKYLTMLCLKYSDKTASEWIIQYTKEDIRFYLRNSNLSIKEISAKLGFANMSHFGSYVRKHLGMSPSDFRHKK